MRAVAVGLLVEEQRAEVAAAWKRAADRDLGGESALAFAVGPLLREMSLALRAERPEEGAPLRSAVLVRSGVAPSRIAREFKLLHRALWETLRATGGVVAADERRAADEWLDEALAASLERLERVRTRADLLERDAAPAPAPERLRAPATVLEREAAVQEAARGSIPPAARPPPLPRARPAARPPPLPIEPLGSVGAD